MFRGHCEWCGLVAIIPTARWFHACSNTAESSKGIEYILGRLLEEIAATLPTDPDYRSLDEIKTLLETHCQPCDKFTGCGCRDFDGQGTGCNQRQRFIRRLQLRMFGCERWQNGLASSGPS
jgi:hypothetical protein